MVCQYHGLTELGWRRVDGFGAEGLLVIIGTLRGVGGGGVGGLNAHNKDLIRPI